MWQTGLEMAKIGEKDVDSEVGRDFTNLRIRTKLLSSCSGAGAGVKLAFATADPLSELVWSPHSGLGLKSVRKPFLLWNVGAEGPLHQSQRITVGDDTVVDHHSHMIIHKSSSHPTHSESSRKLEEGNCMDVDSCHQQTLQTEEIAAPLKKVESCAENENECSLGGGQGSRICLYPDKGVKRKIWDEGAIQRKKEFVMKPDSSFLKWISNMTTTSVSPLPLACQENFKPAAASITTGFRAMFQSLYCREREESSAGGKKIVEAVEVCRQVEPAKDDRKGRTSLWITRLSTDTLRSEKGKEMLMLDAIRNLRLTRADILRWMNSEIPLSHLKGYYLRVRVRLRVEESGGYCVGCITGSEKNGKCMIWVDVGGIQSSVATQYVSNHDFQDDEIKAWWSRIRDTGCRIPSLADLSSKFNHRQTLGF